MAVKQLVFLKLKKTTVTKLTSGILMMINTKTVLYIYTGIYIYIYIYIYYYYYYNK